MTASKFNSKFAAKRSTTAAHTVKPRSRKAAAPQADKPIVDPVVEDAMREYHAAQEKVWESFKIPSGTRLLVAGVSAILTYATSMWFAVPVIEWIVIGAVALTSSAFIGWLVFVLGCVLAIFASVYAGAKAFTAVTSFNFGIVGDVGRTVRDASKRRVSLVRDWFKRGDDGVQYDNVGVC